MNMLKLRWWFALALLAAPLAHAKLNVVATTPDLGALAQAVGGDRIALTSLSKPTEDPHFVDAKPSFVVKLNRADALIEGGAELEQGWLSPLLESSRNPKIAQGAPGRILCAAQLSLLEIPSALDRSKGDIHAAGNPHYLTDPENAAAVAKVIAEAFAQIDAAGAATYRENLAKFTAELDRKLAEWRQRLTPFQGRRIAAYHNLYPYFARRFGVRIDLFLEPKPGIPPSPAHLAEVIAKMKAEGIRVILVEPYQARRTAETVAAATGATVVDVTQYPGGLKGTEGGYLPLLDHLVNALAKALEAPAK